MVGSKKTIHPKEMAARQRAIETQRRRLDKIREEAQRESKIAAALDQAKQDRHQRESLLGRGNGMDTRTTRRFYADLLDIVQLPCGRAPDSILLANLARYRRDWFRSLSDWNPTGDTMLQQQSSLLRHLLTRYEVPAFMEQGWFMDDLSEGREYRRWFLRMTRGENIRACSPPIRLTHRAAHLFLQAPKDCTILGAMRRAQYLAMGGSVLGASELLDTALGYVQPNEAFWETALLFIANHEREMQAGQIRLLANYLHWRVTQRAPHANPGETPASGFSMKGRTLGSLMRDVEVYRAARPELDRPVTWWNRSGIQECEPTEDAEGRTWSIIELLNSNELRREGDTMRHCVAHYDRHCKTGATSIWSVRCQKPETAYAVPIMTIEMRNANREIVQARGSCNQSTMASEAGPLLRAAARRVIAWAERENLSLNWGLLGWNRSGLFSQREELAE